VTRTAGSNGSIPPPSPAESSVGAAGGERGAVTSRLDPAPEVLGPTVAIDDLERLAGPLLTRCRFPSAGTPLVCGVSGGADSLALLALAVAAGCEATAVHVDHGLRPSSADDAAVVEQAARLLGAGVRSERVDLDDGPNLEARARAARHRVLGPDAALGHTADDQAETVLVNLLRGAGPAGVAGMRPGHRHPILALRRAETVELCAALGLDVVDDPTNTDPRFVRNRLRHEVLPLLDDVAGRDVVPLLARHAELARRGVDALDRLAAAVDPADCRSLRLLEPEVARAALRSWLRSTSGERHPPDEATLDRVWAVVEGSSRATDLGGGWRLHRRDQRLSLIDPTVGRTT